MSRRHAILPGPLIPVKPVALKIQECSKEKLMTFLNILDGSFIQAQAVGHNHHVVGNDMETIFHRLSSTTDIKAIQGAYAIFYNVAEKDGIEIPTDEERCSGTCRKNGICCMLQK